MKRAQIDFTKGPIAKSLLIYFLPVLAGALFQQLYSTADAVILGQFAGKTGLAAIDSISNLLKLPVNFFVGLSTGATIIISQFFGAKDDEKLREAVQTAVGFSVAGGAALSVICVLAAPLGLRVMGVPEDIYPLTLLYARVYFSGFAASMIYNVGAGILRAMGDSKTPFVILALSSVINIVLDLLFVAVLGWSAPGAAFATVIAQIISAALALRSLGQVGSLKKLQFEKTALQKIIFIGLPIALQSTLYPIANMTVQSSVNQTGTDNIVAWALCGKLDFLIWLVADSLGAAVSTFVAQNMGAKQAERARRGTYTGMGLSLSMVIFISIILYVWCEPLGRLILNESDAYIAGIAGGLMRVLAPFYFFYVFGEVFGGALRGEGDTLIPMIITMMGTCATRVLWILFLPQNYDLLRVLVVYPISWAMASLGMTVYYYGRSWKKRSLERA